MRKRVRGLTPYLLVAPLVLLVFGLGVVPAIATTVQAFYHVDEMDPPTRFAGLDNFDALFDSPQIRQSMLNTGLYVLLGVLLSTVLGTLFALALNGSFRFRAAALALVILPWALPGVVVGVIWKWIYDPSFGVLNSVLHSLHLIDDYRVFVGTDRFSAILFVELAQVWQITPLSAVIILAALQVIPEDVYAAARVDGCGPLRAFRYVTLPLIRPGIAIAAVQALVASMNIFDQPYVLNGFSDTAGPVMLKTYQVSFNDLNFGQGYAMSLLTTLATVALSLVVLKLVYRKVEL